MKERVVVGINYIFLPFLHSFSKGCWSTCCFQQVPGAKAALVNKTQLMTYRQTSHKITY